MSLLKKLLQNERIAIWGAGYIGYSNAMYFAKHGISSLLVDIDKDKVEAINNGNPPYPEIKTWLPFDIKPFAKLVEATVDWRRTSECSIHFIAVNTEKDGKPSDEALRDVCSKIATCKPHLVIVESTVAPNWTDSIIRPLLGSDRHIAIAPRRDWFTLTEKSLEALDRVVGATSKEALEEALSILNIVSRKVHPATNYKIVELVKAVENAYRHLGIALSYELAIAYPNINICEVLKLCATKWNMSLYQPSIGIGGYCLPLAPQYVISNAKTELSLLETSLAVVKTMTKTIALDIVKRRLKKVCILGLSYKGNLKVHIASPSITLAKALKAFALEVAIHDPLYSDEEIQKLSDCQPIVFPKDLSSFDCVILSCDHNEYRAVNKPELYSNLSSCKLILDCCEVWKDLAEHFESLGISYHAVGDEGWIKCLKP